ncbi:protein GLUTAMINE DUMPER 5-like [Mercurialis annua]|uniref:protein GLUTAMINE DUMPER 5-like n=1 Tax=Mercurialis annua TaxID=3986 RepID=UPI00215E53F9|nr:protein GLUTAMINE DUMPER 5-like [Mercurialis annua]
MDMSSSASNSSAAAAGFWHWNSPLPYLFGGLALMLGVIAVALIILAWSYRKSLSNNQSRDEEAVPEKKGEIMVDSAEPKIVVIMAGDHNPTFLANPNPKFQTLVCTCHNTQKV